MLLNNQWIIEEIKEEIKKYLAAKDNEGKTLQNLLDAAKAVLRGNLQQYKPTSGNKKKNCQKPHTHKDIEAKQYATKQPMDH